MKLQPSTEAIPDWLREIEENSWNLELLISGGALFTLLQIPELFIDFVFTLKFTNRLPGTGLFIVLSMFSIRLLTVGFILHLLLRAYWLGLVCINAANKNGIRLNKINWKRPFVYNAQEEENVYGSILKVDRWCGILMYMSVISVVILLGMMVSVVLLITIPSFVIESNKMRNILFGSIMAGLTLYILDLLSFGFFRKVKLLSYITYPVLKLFDMLTFRFLYQKSLWLFNTNVSKAKFILIFGMVVIVAIAVTYVSLYRSMRWHNPLDARGYRFQMAPQANFWPRTAYRDQVEYEKSDNPSIQSDIISETYLQVLVPYNVEYDYYIQSNQKQYLSDIVEISIDDSTYTSTKWYNAWAKDIDQIGIRANVPIGHLPAGEHTLVIRNKFEKEMATSIPFWKD